MVYLTPKRVPRRETPSDLVQFEFRRAKYGYGVETGTPWPPDLYPPQIRYGWQLERETQQALVPNRETATEVQHGREAGLFRMFAELQTDEQILGFATEFGLLHGYAKRGYRKPNGVFEVGETLAWWRYWIAQVASAVRLMDGSRGKVPLDEYFSTYTHTHGVGIAYLSHRGVPLEAIERQRVSYADDKEDWLASQDLPIGFYRHFLRDAPEVINAYESQDFRTLALQALSERIDDELGKPSYHSPKWLGPHVGIKPRMIADEGRFSLRLVPTYLLDLIWLQVAQAVTGGREYRKCPVCPRWFAIVEYGRRRRSDRVYCSSACKTRAFRDKQAKEQGENA